MYKRLMSLVGTFLILGGLIAGTANVYATAAASPSIYVFAAGALKIELKDLQNNPLPGNYMQASNMAPGDTQVYEATFTNQGSNSVNYAMGFERVDQLQVDSLDQSNRNDAMADALLLLVDRSPSAPGDWHETHTLTEWTQQAARTPVLTLAPGASHRFRFTIDLPVGTLNPAQGGSVMTQLMVFTEQVAGPPPSPTPQSADFTVTKHVGTDPNQDSGETAITFDQTAGTAYFHYTVRNTGPVAFTISSAVDSLLGPVTFKPLTLQPGESATARLEKVYPALADGAAPLTEVGIVTVTGGGITRTAEATVRQTAKRVQPPGSGPNPPVTPPGSTSTPPKAPQTGSLVVRVVGQHTNGQPTLVPGATVRLSNGLMGTTNAKGEVLFANLLLANLGVRAWAADPQNPKANSQVEGQTQVDLTRGDPNQVITITLNFPDLPNAGPTPVAPQAVGSLTGRVCSPKAPGAQVLAIGPDGQSSTVTIAPNGSLGQWRPWILQDLAVGSWTLTLVAPTGERVEQKVVVAGGASTTVPDFSLACTGEPGSHQRLPIAGISMLLVGTALLLWRRRDQAQAR